MHRLQNEGPRDFTRAEELRDRMYDVTPMALNEILQAGELIEEEKSGATDPDHLERWEAVYADLNPDETNALYFSMQEQSFEKHQAFYPQGAIDGRLCLVEAGRIGLFCKEPDGEDSKKIREVREGDIFGVDLFFSFTR